MALLSPLTLGELKLPNRIIMAPLTRSRATGTDGRVPNAMMAEYYTQRASAGLIITEATSVCAQGVGYPNTPGIWSEEQVNGWKHITKAVHAHDGRIFLQLWHVGRISEPKYLQGELPVAPSAIAAKPSGRDFPVPRPLGTQEIAVVVEQFRKGAENAQRAGFDGVEIHGANGYLIDQFLQDGSNHRTDEYGGPIENRARFMLEITDAVVGVWGAARVGMHLAPRGDFHTMGDSSPYQTFTYVAKELGKRKLAFLCSREHFEKPHLGPELKQIFGGTYIANEGFTCESAEAALAAGKADAVAFGVPFLANPDLPQRFARGAPLNPPDRTTFYSGGAKGYTDYPSLANLL